MQKSCKIKHLEDCVRFRIVKITLLKLNHEMGKRILPIWEIHFHFLVRISIGLMKGIFSRRKLKLTCGCKREQLVNDIL